MAISSVSFCQISCHMVISFHRPLFPLQPSGNMNLQRLYSNPKNRLSVLVNRGNNHRLSPTAIPCARVPLSSLEQDEEKGIGIIDILRGKTFFLTGVTGFVAKVIVEKLLRQIPDVEKIYVLIKADNKEVAMKRLKNEVINLDIFNKLRQLHAESYESFMLSKLIPVAGDLWDPELGLDDDTMHMMAQQVDIILNSAANTNFNERYDVSINTNTRGPSHVMAFAKKCKSLRLFLHVSTAYVNGMRKGILEEQVFKNGDSIITMKNKSLYPTQASQSSSCQLEYEKEINYAMTLATQIQGTTTSVTSKWKELGRQRARKFGWHDVYSFTKAMGEMFLDEIKGDISLAIIRPTVVESTFKDPFPGWIEGNRVLDPLLTIYGKGITPGFIGDPNAIMDIIPVDMVANTILVAIAKHVGRHNGSSKTKNSDTVVYHVGSSVANPLTLSCMVKYFYKYCTSNPLLDAKGKHVKVKPFKIYDTMENFSADVWKHLTMVRHPVTTNSSLSLNSDSIDYEDPISAKNMRICRRLAKEVDGLVQIYQPYVFYPGRFDNGNTQSLIESMSKKEIKIFQFDTRIIDWEDYYLNGHIPGLRKHVFKGR